MNWKTALIALLLVDFLALTAYSLYQVGYTGIVMAGLDNWGAVTIAMDLLIALGLICVWLVADARRRGANPWPYVALTLGAGAVGPLVYLLLREREGQPASASAS